jgi:hypothetical protein
LLPNETYYVENIKYTNFSLGKNTKSTNLRIHEPVNVDIKVFILTVAENSGICKFSGIYFIKFEKNPKSTEITLLARTLAIFFNIYCIHNVLKLSRRFATQ